MQPAIARRNRIAIGLPLYSPVSPRWLMEWFNFQGQLKHYDRLAGTHTTAMAYVELAMNVIVRNILAEDYEVRRPSQALDALMPHLEKLGRHRNPDIRKTATVIVDHLMVRMVDYILFIESDNVAPDGLLEAVGSLDPEVHKIVGYPYVSRGEDMIPVPGMWGADGSWHRLTYDEIKPMIDNPGLHEVGSVGMGCTAIHRSVFEQWPAERIPAWFHSINDASGFVGHDVVFCDEAKKFGVVDKIWIDTAHPAGHLGEFQYTIDSYFATHEHYARMAAAKAVPRLVVPHTDGLRDETVAAVDASGLPVEYVRTEGDSGYHDLVAGLWRDGRTFVTVEQDIVPAAGQIQELLDCPHEWCAYVYEYPPFGKYAGMGCAKFSAELLKRLPTAMSETAQWSDPEHPSKHWCRVDGYLKQYLLEHGCEQHIHGEVTHLHRGRPAHDCTPDPKLLPPPAAELGPRLFVTYAGDVEKVEADTIAAAKASGIPWTLFDCVGDEGRWNLYASLWRDGQTFVSIESDIVPQDGDLQELLDCEEPWCVFAGPCPPFGYNVGLGCAKVSAELIRQFPNAMKEIGEWSDDTHTKKHWCRVDGWFNLYLQLRGVQPHVHGPVEHRMKGYGPSHGCRDWSTVEPRPMIAPPRIHPKKA